MHLLPRHAARYVLSVSLAALLAGCAGHRAAVLERQIPGAEFKKQAILDSVRSDAEQLHSMAALANFTLVQKESGAHSFQGSVVFERPDKLYVRGNHYPSGAKIFEMACNGAQWYADFTADNQFYSSRQKQSALAITPLDIARELFFPADWRGAAQIVLARYDPEAGEAELIIREKKSLLRKVKLTGPPWVVAESVLVDRLGRELVKTTRGDYHEENGVRFPFQIQADFPTEHASMSCTIRKAAFNTADISEALFITR